MALVMDSLRCPKCLRGNLFTSPDVDGEIVGLKCFQCGHEPGEHDKGDWRGRVKDKEDLDRSVSGEHPIWRSPDKPRRLPMIESSSHRARPS